MTLPSLETARKNYENAHEIYAEYVSKSVILFGSKRALAAALGVPVETVASVIRRNSVSKLRELAERIQAVIAKSKKLRDRLASLPND